MTKVCEACDDTQTVILPVNVGGVGEVSQYPCPCCIAWSDGFGGLTFRRPNGERVVIMTPAPAGQLSTYIPPPLLPHGMSRQVLDDHQARIALEGLQRPPINKPAERHE